MADFKIPLNSINDQSYDKLPDVKWWLHVKTNLELDSESNYDKFLDGEDQSIIDFDAISYIGSDSLSVDQPRHLSPTCMKNNTGLRKIEDSVNNNDLHFTPKKKDQKEFGFSDGCFLDCDGSDFSVTEKMASNLMGNERPGPWWRTAGKDELASLVAQKSLEHFENCDLPHSQPKCFVQRFSKGVDHDKIALSSLNQKGEIGSSNVDGYTAGTRTSDCSFQDSNSHIRSSQSKDPDSSNIDCKISSENSSITELLEALCHSQTRARDAEKAAQQAYNDKEHILSLFFKQASELFAYKQWLYMLQFENLCLKVKNKKHPLLNLFPAALLSHKRTHLKKNRGRAEKRKISNKKCIGKSFVAFAVGLSLAGAGLLLGWTMGWMFPSL